MHKEAHKLQYVRRGGKTSATAGTNEAQMLASMALQQEKPECAVGQSRQTQRHHQAPKESEVSIRTTLLQLLRFLRPVATQRKRDLRCLVVFQRHSVVNGINATVLYQP